MWSNSSPTKEHIKAADWMRARLLNGKTKYIMAAVVTVLIMVSLTIFVVYSKATPASHVVGQQEVEQKIIPAESIKSVETKPTEEVNKDVKTNVQATINSNGAIPQTEMRVNDQPLNVPVNGTVNKTIESKDGNTDIDISINSDSTGNTQTNSSTNIQLNTATESETSIMSSE